MVKHCGNVLFLSQLLAYGSAAVGEKGSGNERDAFGQGRSIYLKAFSRIDKDGNVLQNPRKVLPLVKKEPIVSADG